jgi:hypothetical protein
LRRACDEDADADAGRFEGLQGMTTMERPEEIVDNPDRWVAEHIREYVTTDGDGATDSTAGTPGRTATPPSCS